MYLSFQRSGYVIGVLLSGGFCLELSFGASYASLRIYFSS